MGDKKFPVRLRYYSQSAGGATSTVGSERLKRGRTLACQSIAFRNRTSLAGNVEIYLENNGGYTFICDQTAPALNRWYWYPYTQHLKDGDRIEAIQGASIQGDALDLHILGYETFGPENVLPRGGQ